MGLLSLAVIATLPAFAADAPFHYVRDPAGASKGQFRVSLDTLGVPCARWTSAKPELRYKELVVAESHRDAPEGCKWVWTLFADEAPPGPPAINLVAIDGKTERYSQPAASLKEAMARQPERFNQTSACPVFRADEFQCQDDLGRKILLTYDVAAAEGGGFVTRSSAEYKKALRLPPDFIDDRPVGASMERPFPKWAGGLKELFLNCQGGKLIEHDWAVDPAWEVAITTTLTVNQLTQTFSESGSSETCPQRMAGKCLSDAKKVKRIDCVRLAAPGPT